MSQSFPIGPETTILELVESHPTLRPKLQARGIDTCCGGSLSLRQVAAVRGIPLDEILSALGASADATRLETSAAAVPRALYSSFVKVALLATLTFGATFGAYNLLGIHLALGAVSPAHNSIHASFQLWGFVLLFIMGVSLHALPKICAVDLPHPGLARLILLFAGLALLLTGWGHFGTLLPGTVEALAAGALLQLAAAASWTWILFALWRRAKLDVEIFRWFLAAGTVWWLAAATLLTLGTARALLSGDVDLATNWNEAVYAATLFGGTLPWIQGMFLRSGPVFLALPATRQGFVRAALWTGQTGALLTTTGGLVLGHPVARLLNDVGLLALAASVAAYVAGMRPFAGRVTETSTEDSDFVRILSLAFGASLLFALLASGYAVADLLGPPPFRLIHDGARHAFALGFVTLMIFAMAGRIVPIFGGTRLRQPKLRAWGAYLIAAGLVLREAQVAASLFGLPELLRISGLSGIVAAAGFWVASFSILATLEWRSYG